MDTKKEKKVNLAQEQRLTQNQMQTFDFRWVLDSFLENLKWFVLSLVLCIGVLVYYLASTAPVFQRSSVMLVKEEGKDGSNVLSELLTGGMGGGSMSGVQNELYILSSNHLMEYVVDDLKLDIAYSQQRGLREISLYKDVPFEVQFDNAFSGLVSFDVTAVRKDGVVLNNFVNEDEELMKEVVVPYDSLMMVPVGNIRVMANGTPVDRELIAPITVSRMSKKNVAHALRKRVTTSEVSKNSTLVNIVCEDENPVRAEAILSSIMEGYRRILIDDKNKVAANTADFIDDRIKVISKELGAVEDELTQLKEDHNLADIQATVSTSMAEGAKAKDKSVELMAQLSVAQYVRDFVSDVSKRNQLIPNVSGIKDGGVERQIQEYNELLLRRNRLLENSGEENSVVQELHQDLVAMRSTIEGSLNSYCETTQLLIDEASKQEARSKASIKAIPLQEKKVLDVTRQQAIKEQLYSFLLQNREEIAMQLASTEANVRVVEVPYGSDFPISPNKKKLLLITLLIAIVIPYLLIYLKSCLNRGVRGSKDIEDFTTIPLLGEIPRGKTKGDEYGIVVSNEGNDHASEAFRLMRTNLNFFDKDAKVLMFTSTTAHEGKSFISRNFAVTLALSGKRVILVDTDIRKGTQSNRLNLHRKEGVSTYLSGQSEDLEALIEHDVLKSGVDVLPAGMVPPNPSELLMRDRLDEMFEVLRKEYDYIVVDNVPAMVVADASIVNRVVDATLYVVREGVMDRRYLPKLERLHLENKFKNLSVVLNDVKYSSHGYGYGYGYGYGGYGYGYGYYSEGKKRSWWKKLRFWK